MTLITTPCIRPDLHAEYRGPTRLTPTRALTYSGIKILSQETPLDFITPRSRKSAAMDFGTIVHKLALGRGDEFTISPYDEFRTKEAKEWRDEHLAAGAIIIKPADLDEALAIAKIVKERIVWATNGEPYETEVPFFWQEGDTWCTGMMDVWCPSLGLAIDPKVTDRISTERAIGHIHNMGWPLQVAWYKRGLESILPEWAGRLRFVNLLIRPDEPYTHRMVEISEAWRHTAERECLRALSLFNRCMAANEWPGYPQGIEYLDPPAWAVRAAMEDE